jgi:uncharacterized protein YkwD
MARAGRMIVIATALTMLGTAGVVAAPTAVAGPPATLSVSAASGNGWVAARWSPAANHDGVIGYQVGLRRYVPSTRSWTQVAYASLPLSVTSRTATYANGTTAQFLVRARNASGYGTWAIVTSVAGRPGAVAATSVAAGDRTATVKWLAGSNNGSPITSYRVYVRSHIDGRWTAWTFRSAPASARFLRLTGLTNGRAYQFQLRAVNARGVGTPGAVVDATPAVPGPPSTTPPTTAPPTSAPPTTTPPTSPPPTTAPPTTGLTPELDRIVADTNAFRVANGKAPLAVHPSLTTIANDWAKQMHDDCFFEHRSSFDVYPDGWRRAGENIAAGYSYTSVVQGWIDSPGHRANMLGDYTHFGVGYFKGSNCYRTYFVQNFAAY